MDHPTISELACLLDDYPSDEYDRAALAQGLDVGSDDSESGQSAQLGPAPSPDGAARASPPSESRGPTPTTQPTQPGRDATDESFAPSEDDAIERARKLVLVDGSLTSTDKNAQQGLDASVEFEQCLGQRGGLVKLVESIVAKEGSAYRRGTLHSFFGGKKTEISKHLSPGARATHLAFLVRLVKAAAGGFFLLSTGCAKEGHLATFLPIVAPFFAAGGQAIVVLPRESSLSLGTVSELCGWQQAIEDATPGRLRFVLANAEEEALVIAPGGEMVDVTMDGVFNSGAIATDPEQESRSFASMAVYKLRFDGEEGREHVDEVGEHWLGMSRDAGVLANLSALADCLDRSSKETLETLRRSKKHELLRKVDEFERHELPRKIDRFERERNEQRAARTSDEKAAWSKTCRGALQTAGSKRELEVDPDTAPIELSEADQKAASDIFQRMKKVRAQVIAKQQRVWTEEEQRSIRSIKEEIVEAMLGRGGFDGASGRALVALYEEKRALQEAKAHSRRATRAESQ